MSNLVFPTLRGRGLPSARVVIPPPVHVRTTPSQREYRSRDALLPRYQYGVPYEWLRTRASSPDLQTLVGFYLSVGGPFDSWLYLDPDDNTATAQPFGVGDGTTTQWQLVRSFGGFAEPISQVLTPGAVVSIDGVPAVNLLGTLGSFEADANADGLADGLTTYNAGTSSGRTWSRVGGNGSTYSQRVAASSLGSGGGDQVGFRWTTALAVTGGLDYTVAADLYATTGTSVSIEVDYYDAGNAIVGAPAKGTWAGNSVSYSRRTLTSTAPAGAVTAVVYLYMHSNSAGAPEFRADNVQMQQASAATTYSSALVTFADGGLANITPAPGAGAVLTWSGQFYRRCRFLGDRLDTEKFMAGLFAARRVEFISVKA